MQHGLSLRATARSDGLITIHIAGVIDNHTLDRFEAALGKATERGARSIVLDCDELRYVSSAGFGELIRYHDQLQAKDGMLVLARVAPKVSVILEMLGLKSLMPVASSLEEAAALVERGPQPIPPQEEGPASLSSSASFVSSAPSAPSASFVPAVPSPRLVGPAPRSIPVSRRLGVTPAARSPDASPRGAPTGIACPFCDARLEPLPGPGRGACPACGAPFESALNGKVSFEWADDGEARVEAIHLTIQTTAQGLAALGGLVEGLLTAQRMSHVPMRRCARETVRIAMQLGDHAYGSSECGLLHVLAVPGEGKLTLRIVDRGRGLEAEADTLFGDSHPGLVDFRYETLADGLNVTCFAFTLAGAGAVAE